MKKLLISLSLFILDISAMFIFKRYPDFFFPGYRTFSQKWIAFLSSVFAIVPFSLWDIIALILFIILIITLVSAIRKRHFFKWLNNVFLIISIFCFVAVYGWLLNHYGPPLSEEIDLEVSLYSHDQLLDATAYYFDMAAKYSEEIVRDEEKHAVKMDFDELAITAGHNYELLKEKYPFFKGSTRRVKRFSLLGDYLLYNGIIGMFMPLSGEASLPLHVPTVPLPYTMCHEAAHRQGLAGEDEANFAAFLTCISSDDVRFIYSGYYSAFSYCLSSLYKVKPESAMTLLESHEELPYLLVRLDRSDTAKQYQKYESPLQDISDQINDTYLKTFNEENGIESYGLVSDYLIAYYLELKK